MNSPKEPLSQAELDLLVQAHRLLEQGDLLQARTLFLSVMQQAPSAPEEFVQVRIAALAGLVARASERSQLVVVTHAAALVSALRTRKRDVNSIELVKESGQTAIVGQGLLDEPPWHWPTRG